MSRIASLRTQRLSASPLHAEDFKEICLLHQDVEIMRHMGGVRTEEQSRPWICENLHHWHLHGFGLWTFRDIVDGTFVGRCGLRRVDVGGDKEVELGYVAMRPYWHKGLGIEMARAVLRTSFASDAGNIIALIRPQNLMSRRLAHRAGFHFERNVTWKSTPAMLYRKIKSL